MNNKKILDLLKETNKLKDTKRYHSGSIFEESTASHSWKLEWILLVIFREYPKAIENLGIDKNKCYELATIHDICENYLSRDICLVDVIEGKVSLETKVKQEEVVLDKFAKTYAYYLKELVDEYNEGLTINAKFIKLWDKMEASIHMLSRLDNITLKEFESVNIQILGCDKYIKDFNFLYDLLYLIKLGFKEIYKNLGKEFKEEWLTSHMS